MKREAPRGSWRAVGRGRPWSFIAVALLVGSAAGVAAGEEPRTEILWRGLFRGDSLRVQASWVPTSGATTCAASMRELADSTEIRPHYLDFEIVDASSRSLVEDQFSGDDFGPCIDELGVEVVRWRDGLLLRISARGWGCEPAGDCDRKLYVHLSGAGGFAASRWTNLDWDPARTEPLEGEVDDGCLTYSMPVRPELRDSSIVFAPMFASEVKEGDRLERPVDDDVPFRCTRGNPPTEPMVIEWFATPWTSTVERTVIRARDPIAIASVVVRAVRDEKGVLRPKIDRIGVDWDGRRGYMLRSTLWKLGFRLL